MNISKLHSPEFRGVKFRVRVATRVQRVVMHYEGEGVVDLLSSGYGDSFAVAAFGGQRDSFPHNLIVIGCAVAGNYLSMT